MTMQQDRTFAPAARSAPMTGHAADVRAVVSRSAQAVDWRWYAALVALCLALVAPLLLVDLPPLLDFPNHLARVFVLASLPHDPVLARMYAPHWAPVPDLALDVIGVPLAHILPIYVVGRILIALSLLLPTLGTIAYNRALGGRWWSLGVGLVAYNSCLLYGFLNFEIAIGLGLLGGAAWLRWRETRPVGTIAAASVWAVVLYFAHLMGLVFFGFLVGGTELFRLRQEPSWRTVFRRGGALLIVCAVPFGLYVLSALARLGGDARFLMPWAKLLQILTTFANYNWPLDLATGSVVLLLVVLSTSLRIGSIPGPAAMTMGLLGVTFIVAPYSWKETFVLDTRFAIMLGFMMFAGFIPGRWPPRFRNAVAVTLMALFLARMTMVGVVWYHHRADLADLRRALAPVQPGQAVYVAETGPSEAPAYWEAERQWRMISDGIRTDQHLGALALIEHRAYWPFEFDNPSQQPLETLAPYKVLAGPVGNLPKWHMAAVADVCGFDYVLMVDADAMPDLPADRFRVLVRAGYATLYAIKKCQ